MSGRPATRRLLRILLWAVGNSVAGAVIALTVSLFREGGLEKPTLVISVLFGNVVGFTAMISSISLFPRLRALPAALRALLLGLALLSGSVVGTLAVFQLYPLFVVRDPRQALAIVAINGVLALIVGGIVYVYEGMHLRLQDSLREVEEVRLVEARLREEAARAELAALQARINPHFFFNTLNTITCLLDEDPAQAEEVVQTLAALFRYTFKVSDATPVALREELEFTRGYLAIERARFGKRLEVVWDVDERSPLVSVPGLILQPLVENAVGHGIAPRAGGGTLRIACRVDGDTLQMDVDDDGVGLDGDPESKFRDGHGLGNVRCRLRAFYRGRAKLSLEASPGGAGTRGARGSPLPAGRGGCDMKLRCVIVDDERPARERLKRLLAGHDEFELVGEAADVGSAVRLIDDTEPELCFLDVQMPEGDGFDVLRRVQRIPRVIFTTAFDHYAVKAFEVQSVDYLLKPFSRRRFSEALERARQSLEQPTDSPGRVLEMLEELRDRLQAGGAAQPVAPDSASADGVPARVSVRRGNKILLLDPSDVLWFEAEETLVFARTAEGRFLVERTLAELERLLAGRFFRAHRGYLVNLSQIREILPGPAGTYEILVQGDERSSVPLSRRQARRLKELFPW